MRKRVALRDVAREQTRGLLRAVEDRERAGDREGIEAVQVAPGGQHRGVAQQIAAGRGAGVATVERAHERGQLVVVREVVVDARELAVEGEDLVVALHAAQLERLLDVDTGDDGVDGRAPTTSSR